MACQRFPDGQLIGHDYLHADDALKETREILTSDPPHALFEPAFKHEDVLARVDILERLSDGSWGLIEVKSSTKLKPQFILDVAIQLWVLRGSGLEVNEAAVLTLNRDYVYEGGDLDVDRLFKIHPVLDEAEELLKQIDSQVSELQAMLRRSEAPEVSTSDHCFDPYECPFYDHCTRDDEIPDHGIDELPRLSASRKAELESNDVSEIRDIPDDVKLSDMQIIVRDSVINERDLIHGDLQSALAEIVEPVYYLDFENFAPAIPRFIGTRPYDPIPFLFSVHVEHDGESPKHLDYLHETSDDPRPILAKKLIDALGQRGSICVYSHFERLRIRDLAEALPDSAADLNAIEVRLYDLHQVVRKNYYHPDFRGSFSIKNVLPAMVRTSGYDDLSIADGQTAALQYAPALNNTNVAERRKTFKDLRDYCERDTLALVELRRALTKLA